MVPPLCAGALVGVAGARQAKAKVWGPADILVGLAFLMQGDAYLLDERHVEGVLQARCVGGHRLGTGIGRRPCATTRRRPVTCAGAPMLLDGYGGHGVTPWACARQLASLWAG